ncbi:MAG TPA: IclR family transcriptional regulator [Pseudonocardiaceae bacterium]|nr:IclR family transcriptional regulator [Pseudonocardiaceae bacterium]
MIQSVDRAMRILGVLQSSRLLALGDIATRLDLAPSTTHGIIKTLQNHGIVLQDRATGRYRLGPGALKLGNVYLDTLDLRTHAMTWAAELTRSTRHPTRVGVLLPGEVVIVHHQPRPDGSGHMPEVGIAIPAHACALGKAILAYSPEGLAALPGRLDRMTSNTITDHTRFGEELDRVRAEVLAGEAEEAVIGECGLAAPVFDSDGSVAGAIGVVVPAGEWPPHDAVPNAVRDAARAVSRELGAPRWPGM